MSTHWSLGVLIWLPIGVVLVAAFGLTAYLLRRYATAHDADSYGWSGEARVMSWVALGAAVVLVIGTVLGFYPYSGQYHKWQPKGGQVASVDSRLLDGANQKFVVRFAGSPEQFGCNDTRCASVDEGDTLWLSCKRTWQYAGEDGWDCNFVSLRDEDGAS